MPQRASFPERLASAAAVAALHTALGWALLTGLGVELTARPDEALTVFEVAPPAPPPEPASPRTAAPRAEDRAAPPARRAAPDPVPAPPPLVLLDPPPLLAAPVAGAGDRAAAGATSTPGPGTGAAGTGDGLDAGGDGTGGGGVAVPARRIAGEIGEADYPPAAVRARAQGDVTLRLAIGADGRVADCHVARSSGSAELDRVTCRLVQARFRYRPARDADGRPVPDRRGWRQSWWLERR